MCCFLFLVVVAGPLVKGSFLAFLSRHLICDAILGQYVQGDIVHGGNLVLKTKTEINLCVRI